MKDCAHPRIHGGEYKVATNFMLTSRVEVGQHVAAG
jgi:hypothetical protein